MESEGEKQVSEGGRVEREGDVRGKESEKKAKRERRLGGGRE